MSDSGTVGTSVCLDLCGLLYIHMSGFRFLSCMVFGAVIVCWNNINTNLSKAGVTQGLQY